MQTVNLTNNNLKGSQPVPKEGDLSNQSNGSASSSIAQGNTNYPQEQNSNVSEGTQVSDAQKQEDISTADVNSREPVQTQTVIKEKVVHEKSGGGCNKSTCCIVSCLGCVGILVGLILLGVFAAPTLSKLLNKVINPNVNVPEIKDVNIDKLNEEIKNAVGTEGSQTINISEDEFNKLLQVQYNTNSNIKLDMRADFTKDEIDLMLKFAKWMPWSVIEASNGQEGKVITNSIKLGPIDISKYIKDAVNKQMQEGETNTQELDISYILASAVFKEDISKITIEKMFFLDDGIDITFYVNSIDNIEDNIEDMQIQN